MIKLIHLLVSPDAAWTKIAERDRSPWFVFFFHALPLIAVGVAVEGYALLKLGVMTGTYDRYRAMPVPWAQVQRYEAVQAGAALCLLFLGALLFQWVADSFQVSVRFRHAFATVAYSLGPLVCLGRALDGIPIVATWACWGLGMLLTLRLLYYGVALVMKPAQTKGFGIFLLGAVVFLLLGGLGHYLAAGLIKAKVLQ